MDFCQEGAGKGVEEEFRSDALSLPKGQNLVAEQGKLCGLASESIYLVGKSSSRLHPVLTNVPLRTHGEGQVLRSRTFLGAMRFC